MPDIKVVSQLPAVAEKSSGGVSVFLLIFEGVNGIVLLLWLDGNMSQNLSHMAAS